ncbi:MAG: hypothetical protein O8C64_11575 [Candidatus Methanoperedens sp.]|nr:hypothetical protein [Candidatus Methanoperedens sp.]MCZ7406596.1 hypothetical protein [Candidatus Methanoperedens sp.]
MDKNMKFDMKSRLLQNEISARPLGLGGFNFSRRIAGKYGIFRKSGRLPSLIFLRLSGLEAKNKKSDPAHRISISNYLKFQFGFYFEFIRQLIKTPDNYYLQKLYNIINIKNGGYLPEADKRPGAAAKTSENTAIGVLSHISFAPLFGFFGQRGPYFKRDRQLHTGQSGGMVNDSQQRNGLTFFNNSAVYQGDRIFTHNQLSSSYPAQDDKKTIQPMPSGIKASHEEVSSGPARTITNAKPREGTDAFRKEIAVSKIDYEPVPEPVQESGSAGRIFLPTFSYLIIRPVRMVTYSANVTVSNLQRLSYAMIFGSRRYQIGNPFASGKQSEEKYSFPAKTMNFHSAGNDAVSARPIYPQNRAAADISYENILQESGTGVNFLFNGSHLITRPVNMTLIYSNIYSNPEIAGYSKRTSDIENAGSEHRIIQAPVSGLRNPIKEGEVSEPPPYRMDVLTTAKKVYRKVSAGNEVSRERIHNEKNQSLEPALSRTGGHPVITNALNRSMTETGISRKTLPGSHLVSSPLKMVLNHSNTVNFSNLKRTSNSGNTLSQSNLGIHHFVPAIQPSNNENQSGEPSRINADGTPAGIRDLTEKGTESFRQERTIVNTHYENIIREYEKTGSKNTIRSHRGGIKLKPADEQFSDLVFPRHGTDLKYGIPGGMKTPVEIPTGEIAYNSSQELIFKKPVVQKTGIIPENREQAEKTVSRNINDSYIRESFKEKPFHEINRIADTVYRMIEKRISIEKDRRGLS